MAGNFFGDVPCLEGKKPINSIFIIDNIHDNKQILSMHKIVLITVSRKKEIFNSLSVYIRNTLRLLVSSAIEIGLSRPTHFSGEKYQKSPKPFTLVPIQS